MYQIKGSYRGRTETIDEFKDRTEAERCLAEYRIAFGADWTLWIEES